MSLFWGNLITMLCLFPCAVCLFFYKNTRDWLSLAGALLSFAAAAPAISCLFFLCMQAIRGNAIWIWSSFLESYRRDAKKAIPLGLLLGVLWAGFFHSLRLLFGTSEDLNLTAALMLAVAGYFLAGFSFLSFLQLAAVELPFHGVLRNGLLLIFAGKGRSFALSLFVLVLAVLGDWYGELAFFVLLIGVLAICVLTGEMIFFPVFEELFLYRDEDDAV